MYVLNFEKNPASLTLTFETITHVGLNRIEENFKQHGLPVNIYLAHSGDSYDRYEILATSWADIFKLLSVYLLDYVDILNSTESVKCADRVLYAYQQLNELEKKQCESFYAQFKNDQLKRNAFYTNINAELIEIAKKLHVTGHEITFAHAGSETDIQDIIAANSQLALGNSKLYQSLIDAARATCDRYNKLAMTASSVLNEKNNGIDKLKKYIAPAEMFEYLQDYANNEIKIITNEDVSQLNKKIEHLLQEINACQAIIAASSPKEHSEFEILCHKYASFPSPLIWIIHDKELSEAMKLALIDELATKTSMNNQSNNMSILAGEPETRTVNMRSPLMHAVEFGSLGIIDLLLKKGADINALNTNGLVKKHYAHSDYNYTCNADRLTALHQAVKRGDAKIIELLLKNGANVNAKNIQGQSPLHWVTNVESAKLLLAYGAEPNFRDKEGDTPLHLLSAEIFDKPYFSENVLEQQKYEKSCANSLELMQLLIQHGANVNQQNKRGYSPLHNAVQTGISGSVDYVHIKNKVELLCENGADVNLITMLANNDLSSYRKNPTPGMTPILCLYDPSNIGSSDSNKEKRLAIAQVLLNHGANLKQVDGEGNTLLHKLVREHELKAIEFFLGLAEVRNMINFQASVTSPTPLHVAAYWGAGQSSHSLFGDKGVSLKIIQILLENGADPLATFNLTYANKAGKKLSPYEYGLTADSNFRHVTPKCNELKLIKEWENKVHKLSLDQQQEKISLARAIAALIMTNLKLDYKNLFLQLMGMTPDAGESLDQLRNRLPNEYSAAWHLINKYMIEFSPAGDNITQTNFFKKIPIPGEKNYSVLQQGSHCLMWRQLPKLGNYSANDDQQLMQEVVYSAKNKEAFEI